MMTSNGFTVEAYQEFLDSFDHDEFLDLCRADRENPEFDLWSDPTQWPLKADLDLWSWVPNTPPDSPGPGAELAEPTPADVPDMSPEEVARRDAHQEEGWRLEMAELMATYPTPDVFPDECPEVPLSDEFEPDPADSTWWAREIGGGCLESDASPSDRDFAMSQPEILFQRDLMGEAEDLTTAADIVEALR
jgi:hypothetical protein